MLKEVKRYGGMGGKKEKILGVMFEVRIEHAAQGLLINIISNEATWTTVGVAQSVEEARDKKQAICNSLAEVRRALDCKATELLEEQFLKEASNVESE